MENRGQHSYKGACHRGEGGISIWISVSSEELGWLVAFMVLRTIASNDFFPESHSFSHTERTVVLEERRANMNLYPKE